MYNPKVHYRTDYSSHIILSQMTAAHSSKLVYPHFYVWISECSLSFIFAYQNFLCIYHLLMRVTYPNDVILLYLIT